MSNASDLIETLATRLAPVKRLSPPLMRALLWLLLAALVLGLLAVTQGLRADLEQRMHEPLFVVGLAASLFTGILAAVSAFLVSLPDRSRLWLLLPIPALVVWVSTIGYGCLTDWVNVEAGSIRLGETAQCFATLILSSLPLSFAFLIMLRYAAVTRPATVATVGSLAVAALTATAMSLYHSIDATLMILMWTLGMTALIVTLGSLFGRRMFGWVGPRVIGPQR